MNKCGCAGPHVYDVVCLGFLSVLIRENVVVTDLEQSDTELILIP